LEPLPKSLAGLLMFTQRVQVPGQSTDRVHGVGVVVTEHPTSTNQGVLVELTSLLALTQSPQVEGQGPSREQGSGMVVAQYPAATGKSAFDELEGLLVLFLCK
jgi:hypothetical protein